jgi:hypothetical protein
MKPDRTISRTCGVPSSRVGPARVLQNYEARQHFAHAGPPHAGPGISCRRMRIPRIACIEAGETVGPQERESACPSVPVRQGRQFLTIKPPRHATLVSELSRPPLPAALNFATSLGVSRLRQTQIFAAHRCSHQPTALCQQIQTRVSEPAKGRIWESKIARRMSQNGRSRQVATGK